MVESMSEPADESTETTEGATRSLRTPDAVEIRIGISACLLGAEVRYDGSHCRDRLLLDGLGEHVTWVPVCPEVGAGMGVPRPTLRLVGDARDPRLVTGKDGHDWTDAVAGYSEAALERLAGLDLCGYVLKSRSPTCGMERVRVYDGRGVAHKNGMGVFARALKARNPLLPVEEDGRLRDPGLREAFFDAVFALARWRQVARDQARARPGAGVDALMEFHRKNKLLLRAHSPWHAAELGRMLARARDCDGAELTRRYGAGYMQAMNMRATRGRHVDTLRFATGRLRRHISATARTTLHEAIDDFGNGQAPRAVPVALLRYHAREHGLGYLAEQSYLEPYPRSLRRAG